MGATSLDVGVVMGAVVAILGSYFAIAKYLVDRFDKIIERQDESQRLLVASVADSIREMRQEDKQYQDAVLEKIDYANTQRDHVNGRIGDAFVAMQESMESNQKVLIKAITNVKEQHVVSQTVEHETVQQKDAE